jgi:hypothetical protein
VLGVIAVLRCTAVPGVNLTFFTLLQLSGWIRHGYE